MKLVLYDTTLRDGAQAEGVHFSLGDKLRLAERLAEFGIHYIEGGWPGSNEKDIEFFKAAKDRNWGAAKIAAFGSTRKPETSVELDAQVKLLLDAETPVVTFFGKTWLLHVTDVLRTTADENKRMIADTTAFLKQRGREVIYDAEHFFDGYFDNPAYALETLQAAADAGADSIVLCDTNGGRLPSEIREATLAVKEKFSVPIGIHTHDDCGLAVANAIAAVDAGALHVQGTFNGYGERTGNCNLTTVIPILEIKMRKTVLPENKLAQLREISRFVDELANQNPDTRAPFVGISSFAHKGGMHVNAINKVASSFEHIDPALVGNTQRVLVGELSGRTNIMMKARQLGIQLDEKSERTRQILQKIKKLESQGYEFEAADASFELLVLKSLEIVKPFFKLNEYHASVRKNATHGFSTCEATLKIEVDDHLMKTVDDGDGPVNALDGALRKALIQRYPQLAKMHLVDYKVRIINPTAGTAAKIRVLIQSTDGQKEWGTVGVSDNVIEASWQALTDSIEYFLLKSQAQES
ncbi:MAG: citramalate synthase [Verrucomicrobiota bacterium]